MARISNADQQRWMTLVDAIAHIKLQEKCGSVEAQVQLKAEIGHGRIPAKWSDTEGSNDAVDLEYFQRSQLVLSGPGLALDNDTERCRPLLVLRPAVLATWPQARSNAATASERIPRRTKNRAQREIEEEHARWMSLVEAVEHIRILCHCTSVEALRQLKNEIGDGMVPVKWSGSKAVSGNPDDDWTCTGPDGGYLKTSQFLLVGVGFAPEKDEDIYQLRPLLIERPAVQRLWPLEDKDVHCRNLDSGGGEDEPLRRRSFTKDEMRNAAREVYRGAPEDPPNMDKAGRKICQRLAGADRDAVREILREEEFAKLRRPSGNQPKHGKSMGYPPND